MHQLAPPSPAERHAAQQQAQQAQQQQAGAAPPLAQQQAQQPKEMAAEQAALRALLQRAGGIALSDSEVVAGAAVLAHERQLALADRTSEAAALRADASAEQVDRWLKRSTDPELGHAGVAHAALLAQRRALGGAPPAPLPRLHGRPPPENLGAAVRHVLLRRPDVEQYLRKAVAEIATRLLREQQGRGGGGGGRDERERRRSGASAEPGGGGGQRRDSHSRGR